MWRKLWFNEDLENKIRQVLKSGIAEIDHKDGLIKPTGNAMNYDTNWLFFGNTVSGRDCFLWHSIMFNHFNLVPSFCKINCYKVVVKVRNFREAFLFYNLMNASAAINADCCGIHGKCGIDSRHYTDNAFNGFIYCNGPDDAEEKYATVRSMVNNHIDDGASIPIVIKRSCTEFERQYGPTDNPFWQSTTPEEQDLENRLRDIFTGHWSAAVQPDWLKNKTILFWAKWANSHGDKTWVEVLGKDFLTMPAVTYHNKGGVDEEKEQTLSTLTTENPEILQ